MANPAKDVLREIKEISASGFDFVEISVEPPNAMPKHLLKNTQKVKKTIQNNNLFALGHTAWFMDLGSLYENIRKQWIEEAKKVIDTANALEFEKQSFHSYCAGLWDENKKSYAQVLNNYAQSMNTLIDYAKAGGLKIMLEPLIDKNGEIGSYSKINTIFEKSPRLFFHLDTGHAFIQGKQGLITKFINQFKNKLEHIHLHDNNGKEDQHLALGKGKICFKKIAKQLKKIQYNKTIKLEVFHPNRKAAVASMKKIKKLLK